MAHESDNNIRHQLMTAPENRIDFDRTWNRGFTLIHCGDFNSPLLEHRLEKYRQNGQTWDKDLVTKFDMSIQGSSDIRKLINTFIDNQTMKENELKDRQGSRSEKICTIEG